MKVTITKIHDLKYGQQYEACFRRVEFAVEGGHWAHTDLVPSFRNYARWQPIEVGATYDGARMIPDTSKIDADSPVSRIDAPPIAHVLKKRPAPPPDPQMSLL